MSLFGLVDPEKETSQVQRLDGGNFSTAGDVFSAQFKADTLNYNSNSEFNAIDKAYGEVLESDVFKFDRKLEEELDPEERQMRQDFRSAKFGIGGFEKKIKIQQLQKKLKAYNPEKYSFDLDARSKEIAREAKLNAEKKAGGNDTTLGTVAGFAGSFAASFTDPVELMATAIPIGKAKSILGAFAIGAAENVAIEGVKQPGIAKWQKDLGQEYGFEEIATNVGAAALFGGVISGGGKTVGKIIDARAQKRIKKFEKEMLEAQVSEAVKQGNPDVPIRLNVDDVEVDAPEVRASDQLAEASRNPDLPEEVRDAAFAASKHVRDLENRPPEISAEEHLDMITEINKAVDEGRMPDLDAMNARVDDALPLIESSQSNLPDATPLNDPINGEVSWYNEGSGEGVIRANGKDYYVHYSALDGNEGVILSSSDRKSLKPGQKVKLDVLDDEFARHATRVIEPKPEGTKIFQLDKSRLDAPIKDRIDEMVNEINNAQKGEVVTTFKEADVGGAPIVKRNGIKSTFPKWFGELGFKSKADFKKVIARGKGVRYDRLLERASEDLEKGYETSFGFVPPLKDQPKLESDIFPEFSDATPDATLRQSEISAQTVRSDNETQKAIESLDQLIAENPNQKFIVNNKELTVADIKQKFKDNNNAIKALDQCKVS